MAKKQATIKMQSMTIIALALTLLIPVFIQPSVAASEIDSSFSIIWISDTQYLTESHPIYFDNLCRWIVQNKEVYNVKMVVHTGDLVNDEDNRTQWLAANQSMGILLDNGIPYCWNAGNHDYDTTTWIGNQFMAFNPEVMQSKPYWVSDEQAGINTAVHFNVSGWDCLIVNVAFDANSSALVWANNLLDANPQSHAIAATHDYLNKAGGYDSWATNFKNTILDTHANVFLALSGHYHPTFGNRTRVGGRDELLFNQQDAYDKMGAASARILTFDTAKGTVTVQTYNLYLNQFADDSNNNFTLITSFHNDSMQNGGFPTALVVVVLVAVVVIVPVCLFLVKIRSKRRINWSQVRLLLFDDRISLFRRYN